MFNKENVEVQQEGRQAGNLTFTSLFQNVVNNWLLYLASVLVLLCCAFFYIRYTTPKYRAYAKILVKDSKKGGDLAGSGLFQELDLLSDHNSTENEVELLKSRTLLERTVDALDLNVRYFTEGKIKTKESYFDNLPVYVQLHELNEDSLDGTVLFIDKLKVQQYQIQYLDSVFHSAAGDTISLPFGKLSIVDADKHHDFDYWPVKVAIARRDDVVAGIRDVISIFPTSKTVSTIELTISDPLPERGESILNTLLRIYDQMNKDDKNRIADSTIAFIDERLQIVASELGNVEGDIEKFRMQNKLTDISSQGKLLLDNSFAYLKELNQAEVQIEVVNALETYLRNTDNRARLVPTSLTLQDPTLVSMVQAYNAAQIEADRRAQNTASNNPVMQQLTVQINSLRDDILATLGNLKRSLVITRDNLKRKSDQLYNQMSRVPGNEKLFLEFSRQQSIKQELYLYLLQKREETSVSKAANVDIVRIVDSGKSDTKPYFPRPSLIYILAVIVGLILPGIILFARSLLNTRILSKADVVARTNTQVIAEIMHNENKEESLVVEPGSRTVISEQFRTLRTNLQYLLPGPNDKCIMITSSMSAEGKSFVAMNLASAIELTGKRVVLLELDLRKPKISKMLELDHATGFTNYIINKSHIEDIIIPVEHGSGLFVVPSGPVPPNPSELLLSPKVNEFFDHLKLHFDYIIIDTAPVGLVSDAQLLARYADTTLYIVRHRYTFKQQITLVEDLRKRRKLPRMNIVINDIRSSRHLSYGYGYSSYGNEEYFKGSDVQKGRGKRIWV